MDVTTEIETLRAEIRALKQTVAAMADDTIAPGPTIGEDGPVSRRSWLRTAGAVAAGGAAAMVASRPAAAATGDVVKIGNDNDAAAPTSCAYTGSASAVGFLFQTSTALSPFDTVVPAAVGAWAMTAAQPTGLYAFSSVNGGNGVVAVAVGDDGYGVRASGSAAALRLVSQTETQPSGRTGAHVAGEIESSTYPGGSDNSDLWACVADGSPGTWRKLAGPATAGSFHAITPTRVYDSRLPQPLLAPLAAGADRVVSVADGRDPSSGAVSLADVVPVGATAVAFNLTITATAGQGFLAITPGDAATTDASIINWFASGYTAANASVVKLDSSRQVKVFAGGAGQTDFIVDINGYYL